MNTSSRTRILKRLAACALWLGVWQAAGLLVGSDILLASPLDTCRRLVSIVASERFLPILWFSFSRIAGGFLAAFVLGVALGFLANRSSLIRELLAPLVLAFKSIPVACIVVLLLIWVGSREVSGIAVFLMAFPALYLATVEGLGQVDEKLGQMLSVFGVGPVRRLLAHTWPSLLPYLVATSRNACGMAWKAGVAAELIGTPLGSVSYLCEQAFLWLLRQTGPVALRCAVPRAGVPSAAPAQPGPIALKDAALGYDGMPVIEKLTLSLAAGERGVLTDASGTGKTTLLLTVAGLLPELAGTVQRPQSLSMVFQETRLIEELDAEDNVLLVGAGGLSRTDVRSLLLELLPEEALGRPVRELSGGQRRRVELARALAHPSAALLLDEPFSSLDEETHEQAVRVVVLHLNGRTLLMSSHAPEDVSALDARQLTLS